ncbi:MAG TPA: hypothetical protein VFQ91_01930 [Bryobacteraceae bacterium]|nr:hypothetical protein [Bryobacteraceae bacterium]
MRTARPKSLLERSADTDLWRHTLSQIPVLSGRLVYLASLRSPITGRYEHHGLSLLFGETESDKAIRNSHRRAFQEWLAMGLEEKADDLDHYLQSTGEDPGQVLRHWAKSAAWNAFQPTGALSAEKSLFSSDMKTVVKILSLRYGVAAQGHSA